MATTTTAAAAATNEGSTRGKQGRKSTVYDLVAGRFSGGTRWKHGAGSGTSGVFATDLSGSQPLFNDIDGLAAAAFASTSDHSRSQVRLSSDPLFLIRGEDGGYGGPLAGQTALGKHRAALKMREWRLPDTSTGGRRGGGSATAAAAGCSVHDGTDWLAESQAMRTERVHARNPLTIREYQRFRDKDRRSWVRTRSRKRLRDASLARAERGADDGSETETENENETEHERECETAAGGAGSEGETARCNEPTILHEDDNLWSIWEEQRYLDDAYGWTAPTTSEPSPAMPESSLMECIHYAAAQYFHRTGHLGPVAEPPSPRRRGSRNDHRGPPNGDCDGNDGSDDEEAAERSQWIQYLCGHRSSLRRQFDPSALVALAVFVEEYVKALVDPAIEDRLRQNDVAAAACRPHSAAADEGESEGRQEDPEDYDPQLAWRDAILAEHAENVDKVEQRQRQMQAAHQEFEAALERAMREEASHGLASTAAEGEGEGATTASTSAATDEGRASARAQTEALRRRLRRLERLQMRAERFDAVSWELPGSPVAEDAATALDADANAEADAAPCEAPGQGADGPSPHEADRSTDLDAPAPRRALPPCVAAAAYSQHPISQWQRDNAGQLAQQHLDALVVAAEAAWQPRRWYSALHEEHEERRRRKAENKARARQRRKERRRAAGEETQRSGKMAQPRGASGKRKQKEAPSDAEVLAQRRRRRIEAATWQTGDEGEGEMGAPTPGRDGGLARADPPSFFSSDDVRESRTAAAAGKTPVRTYQQGRRRKMQASGEERHELQRRKRQGQDRGSLEEEGEGQEVPLFRGGSEDVE
ncbi:hypothetical protein ACQY0O_001096 [Thecaphora frezii]